MSPGLGQRRTGRHAGVEHPPTGRSRRSSRLHELMRPVRGPMSASTPRDYPPRRPPLLHRARHGGSATVGLALSDEGEARRCGFARPAHRLRGDERWRRARARQAAASLRVAGIGPNCSPTAPTKSSLSAGDGDNERAAPGSHPRDRWRQRPAERAMHAACASSCAVPSDSLTGAPHTFVRRLGRPLPGWAAGAEAGARAPGAR